MCYLIPTRVAGAGAAGLASAQARDALLRGRPGRLRQGRCAGRRHEPSSTAGAVQSATQFAVSVQLVSVQLVLAKLAGVG